MKEIKDLRIDMVAWRVTPYSIIEEVIIEGIAKRKITTTMDDFDIPLDTIGIDRLKSKYNNTLCITYLDAVDLATTICFDKMAEHFKVIHEKASAIEAVRLRIHELNDIKAIIYEGN